MSITTKELSATASLYQSRFDINENFAIVTDAINDVHAYLDVDAQILDGMTNVKSNALSIGDQADPSFSVTSSLASFTCPITFNDLATFNKPVISPSYADKTFDGGSTYTLSEVSSDPDNVYKLKVANGDGSDVNVTLPAGANGQKVMLISEDSSDFTGKEMIITSDSLLLPGSSTMVKFTGQNQTATFIQVDNNWYLESSFGITVA